MIPPDNGSLTQKIYDLSCHTNNLLNNKMLLQKGSLFMVSIYTQPHKAQLRSELTGPAAASV